MMIGQVSIFDLNEQVGNLSAKLNNLPSEDEMAAAVASGVQAAVAALVAQAAVQKEKTDGLIRAAMTNITARAVAKEALLDDASPLILLPSRTRHICHADTIHG